MQLSARERLSVEQALLATTPVTSLLPQIRERRIDSFLFSWSKCAEKGRSNDGDGVVGGMEGGREA